MVVHVTPEELRQVKQAAARSARRSSTRHWRADRRAQRVQAGRSTLENKRLGSFDFHPFPAPLWHTQSNQALAQFAHGRLGGMKTRRSTTDSAFDLRALGSFLCWLA